MKRSCKDCLTEKITTKRPAPHPGPRCATHHRTKTKAARLAAKERHIARTYGLPAGSYATLLAAQGGVCAGCGPRTGRNGTRGRRLAVDHDHACAASHGRILPCCVRGLLCSACNKIIGDLRDDPATLLRLAAYLTDPPARRMARP